MRWAVLVLAGCHVVTQDRFVRPLATEQIVHRERATAGKPTLVLTDAGKLRFVEPLECPSEELVKQVTGVEVVRKPNYATLVVGIVASAVGGVLIISSISESDPGGSPLLYAGLGLAGAGLPFAIGPFVGNRVDVRPDPGEPPPERRPGPPQPCGERAVVARAATLKVRGLEVHGAIDRDGVFAVSPYQLIDAFAPTASGIWDITATVETPVRSQVQVTLDHGRLATLAKAFLATAEFDTTIEPMRIIPGIQPGALRASLTSTADGPAIRILLPLANDGPGPAWAVRGVVVAPSVPAIDGRILYAGSIAKGAVRSIDTLIPVTPDAAAALRNTNLEFSIELRDAHGTAPSTPVRFKGIVLVDAPR